MTLIEGSDYIIRSVPWLTGDLPALVSVDEDGFYSIYVNDALCPQAQREAADHELQHITRDDFFNDLSIRVVEGQAVPEPVGKAETKPTPEEIEAALRAWAAEWVRLKIAEIENRGKRKKRRRPADDDAPLPPAIW